jgi:hypothetical protein
MEKRFFTFAMNEREVAYLLTLQLEKDSHMWYSDTPRTAPGKGLDDTCPRLYSVAVTIGVVGGKNG